MSEMLGWAQFGDVGGGHRLIDATGIDAEALSSIRWHTDLPPEAPAEWPSYFAGYPMGDYYVVQFTQPDPQASRPGMVKTTLTVVGLTELASVDLMRLRRAALTTDAATAAPPPSQRLEGLGATLDLLAESQPVYWIGTSTFDLLVDQLWDVLSADDRAALVFGLLFTPSSIPYPQIERATHGVYLVPEQLRVRFRSNRIIDSANPPPPGEPSIAILNGGASIATDLGIESPSLRQSHHLAKANRYFNEADRSRPDELRACAHLVRLLAPEPERGRQIKQRIGERIVESHADASFSHIRGLRTLELPDFGLDFSAVVDPWAATVIENPNRVVDLEAALTEVANAPRDPLCVSISAALGRHIAARGQAIASYFEAALDGDHETVFAVLAGQVDHALADPLLASVNAIGSREWVHEVARRAQLPLTHSQSCPTEDPIEAFRAHLAIPGNTEESCLLLATRCGAQGAVQAAITLEAAVLVRVAADAVRHDVDALLPARPAIRGWLSIWALLIEDGADPWTWLEPREALEPVFDAALEGDGHAKTLVDTLSAFDEANLASYARRAEAWDVLAEPARSRLLHRTAVAVVLNGEATDSAEPVLRRAIVSAKTMAAAAAVEVSKAIDALEILASHANSDSAKAIVKAADLRGDAHRLVDLIERERWLRAARYVIRRAPNRSDLTAVETRCRHLLPLFDVNKYLTTPRKRSKGDSVVDRFDVLIVTALRLERLAVREHLTGIKQTRRESVVVDIGEFHCDEALVRVGIIEVGPGNADANTYTMKTVRNFQPDIVLMVGVAGSLKDLKHGDVVASNKVYWVEPGKSHDDHIETRPDFGPVSDELVQIARAVAADDTWQSRRQRQNDEAPIPRARVAPIAISEKVIASRSSPEAQRIKTSFSDTVAVAMEDVGVMKAASATGSQGLSIRAVSDLLDDKDTADANDIQLIAADNAAAFAFELLSRIPLADPSDAHMSTSDIGI